MITLPFPSSALAGHNKGTWRNKSGIVRKAYADAFYATKAANLPPLPAEGDIRVSVAFYPPNNRGDRINYPNRMKPAFDGIASALGVNDKRFLPSYTFHDVEKPGRVVIVLS